MTDPTLTAALAEDALRAHIIAAVARDERIAALFADQRYTRDLDYLLALLRKRIDGVSPSTEDESRLAAIGACLVARGYQATDLAAAYRVPLRVVVDHMRAVGAEIGRGPSEMLSAIQRLLDVCNATAATVADGYHRAMRQESADFLHTLLFGHIETEELTRQAHRHSLDPNTEYLAFRARPAPGGTIDSLAAAVGGRRALVGTDLVGFVTATPSSCDGGVCGVGPPRLLPALADSFRMATRALDAADRQGATGVHEFTELGLLPAISSDTAVTEALHRRYLAPLGDTGAAAEIADTLHAYLEEGRHVARTAERLFVHPNTVRYRIRRFEELTGVSLRGNTTVVFEVLWALTHRGQVARS
jgi:PucR C-terminal helix-turn-helix domain